MRAPDSMGEAPGEVVKMIDGILFSKGDKVRLTLGKRRSDASDILINGRIATIEIIYTDYEDNVHFAVTLDDDPGQEMQRDLGIYRFFSPEEVELINKFMEHKDFATIEMEQAKTRSIKKRVMIAGVGNMFMKDDGFGGAVIKKLLNKKFPEGVEIKDFGTGGLKLAYDLMKGYDSLILLDASQRGEKPGTLYVIEPSENDINPDLEQGGPIDPHGADPVTVLRFVKSIGSWPGKVLIVACEPETVDDFEIGLSESVHASIDKAAEMVEDIIKEIYSESK